jgi:tetratricopeptide (TPR) repeat protein
MFRHPLKLTTAGIFVLSIILSSCNTSDSKSASPAEELIEEDTDKDSSAGNATAAADADAGAEAQAENAAEVLDSFYSETDDSGKALAALEEADVESMDNESRLVYAVLLRSESRLDESRVQLTKIVEEDPSMADAWFNLALVEHSAGNDSSRDSALESAISADDSYAEAYAFRGNLAIADSQWDRAEANLRKALDLEPESAESLVGLAWVLAKTERIEQALPLLDLAVELEPEYVYARVDRSRVNVALRNYNDAEADLDIAIEKEPDVPWHYLDRARIRLRHFKDYEGALEDLETVERLDPDNFFAVVYLAGLHDEERRFQTARLYYRKVVEMRPDYIWAYMPLGKFAWMNNEYEEAVKWYLKAAAEDPEDFSLILMAAVSMLQSGNVSEADKLFSETLRMFEQGESSYEVVRFCAERSSDYYAVNALNKETNEALRERLWFYLGAIYKYENNDVGASAVFERLAARSGEMEYDLASAALYGMEN